MAITNELVAEPLRSPFTPAGAGGLNVGESRVSLDSVVHAFDEGETPEGIVDRFPTLELADVYQAVAYYLKHPAEVRAYLATQKQRADEFLEQSTTRFGSSEELRARLMARRSTNVLG